MHIKGHDAVKGLPWKQINREAGLYTHANSHHFVLEASVIPRADTKRSASSSSGSARLCCDEPMGACAAPARSYVLLILHAASRGGVSKERRLAGSASVGVTMTQQLDSTGITVGACALEAKTASGVVNQACVVKPAARSIARDDSEKSIENLRLVLQEDLQTVCS